MHTVPTEIEIGNAYRRNASHNWTVDPYGYGGDVAVYVRYGHKRIAVIMEKATVRRATVRRIIGTGVVILLNVNARHGYTAATVVDIPAIIEKDDPVDHDANGIPVYDLSGDPYSDFYWQGEEWEATCYPHNPDMWDGRAWKLDDLTAVRIVAQLAEDLA